MEMRGLANFIQDIRKATSNKDEEQKRIDLELAKIRNKFKDSGKLSAYDRKKYVCKLMFIAMLGYTVDFGHMEGLQLLSGESSSEKLIGYLSVTVFLHEQHELLTLATHTIHLDLVSGKEFNTCLALTAIANAGGRDYADAMVQGVKKLILTKNIAVIIRKKALLTMLRLYRKHREVVDLEEILPAVVGMIAHPNAGVANCAVSFLLGIMDPSAMAAFDMQNIRATTAALQQQQDASDDQSKQRNIQRILSDVPKHCVHVLEQIIIRKSTDVEYIYYSVPAPWLQTKIMRLLQFFPCPEDPELLAKAVIILGKIQNATQKVLKEAQTHQKQRGTQNRSNAMNAVLVELVSLVIRWDCDPALLNESMAILGSFVEDKKESNLRYLGLGLVTRLSFCDSPDFHFATYVAPLQQQIIVSLHDPDLSIRKRALELLYAMCNKNNADEVIGELLEYLPLSVAGGSQNPNISAAAATLLMLQQQGGGAGGLGASVGNFSMTAPGGTNGSVMMSGADDAVAGHALALSSHSQSAALRAFRADLVLMIAALAEKFCVDYSWYCEILLTLLHHAGDCVPVEIADRLIHVVVETPNVQKNVVEAAFMFMTRGSPHHNNNSNNKTSSNNNNNNNNNDPATSSAAGGAAAATAAGSNNPSSTSTIASSGGPATVNPSVPDITLRIGAFLLGEYGYQIAASAGSSPKEQVQVVLSALALSSAAAAGNASSAGVAVVRPPGSGRQGAAGTSSTSTVKRNINNNKSSKTPAHVTAAQNAIATQCMLLTTLVKLYNFFAIPEVRSLIVEGGLRRFAKHPDAEVQERACEYLTLIECVPDAVLQRALEPMPAFLLNTSNNSNNTTTSSSSPSTKLPSSRVLQLLEQRRLQTDGDVWVTQARDRDAAQAAAMQDLRQQLMLEATANNNNNVHHQQHVDPTATREDDNTSSDDDDSGAATNNNNINKGGLDDFMEFTTKTDKTSGITSAVLPTPTTTTKAPTNINTNTTLDELFSDLAPKKVTTSTAAAAAGVAPPTAAAASIPATNNVAVNSSASSTAPNMNQNARHLAVAALNNSHLLATSTSTTTGSAANNGAVLLFESSDVAVRIVGSSFRGADGRVTLNLFAQRPSTQLQEVQLSLLNCPANLIVQFKPLPAGSVAAAVSADSTNINNTSDGTGGGGGGGLSLFFACRATGGFTTYPTVQISAKVVVVTGSGGGAGGNEGSAPRRITEVVTLPIGVQKFITPYTATNNNNNSNDNSDIDFTSSTTLSTTFDRLWSQYNHSSGGTNPRHPPQQWDAFFSDVNPNNNSGGGGGELLPNASTQTVQIALPTSSSTLSSHHMMKTIKTTLEKHYLLTVFTATTPQQQQQQQQEEEQLRGLGTFSSFPPAANTHEGLQFSPVLVKIAAAATTTTEARDGPRLLITVCCPIAEVSKQLTVLISSTLQQSIFQRE